MKNQDMKISTNKDVIAGEGLTAEGEKSFTRRTSLARRSRILKDPSRRNMAIATIPLN